MKTKIPTEIENIDEIVELWKSNRLTTLEYLQKVSEEELLKRPEGGWSLSEVGEHLYLTQLNIARMIPVALGGKVGFPSQAQNDLDFRKIRVGLSRPTGFKNPENLSPLNNYPLSELLSRLTDAEKKLINNLKDKTKGDLEKRGVEHPAFGPLNLFNFLWVMSLHEGLHAYAIKQRVVQILGK